MTDAEYKRVNARVEFLRALRTIGKHFNNEIVEEYWLQNGLSDDCDEDEILGTALNDEWFRSTVHAFENCVSSEEFASSDGFYFYYG